MLSVASTFQVLSHKFMAPRSSDPSILSSAGPGPSVSSLKRLTRWQVSAVASQISPHPAEQKKVILQLKCDTRGLFLLQSCFPKTRALKEARLLILP